MGGAYFFTTQHNRYSRSNFEHCLRRRKRHLNFNLAVASLVWSMGASYGKSHCFYSVALYHHSQLALIMLAFSSSLKGSLREIDSRKSCMRTAWRRADTNECDLP